MSPGNLTVLGIGLFALWLLTTKQTDPGQRMVEAIIVAGGIIVILLLAKNLPEVAGYLAIGLVVMMLGAYLRDKTRLTIGGM